MSRLRSPKKRGGLAAAFGVALALGVLVADPADARRGGSFGSRGYRTYTAPRSSPTAPGYVPPVQRSMTPNTGYAAPGGAYAPRPGYGYNGYGGYQPRPFGGFGGFMGGLITGGLIGGLFGHGWGGGWGGGGWGGGGGGLLTVLIQLVILGFILSMVLRMFRRRAAYSAAFAGPDPGFAPGPQGFGGGPMGGAFGGGTSVPPTGPAWDIPITPADQATFEGLLRAVQDAFAREDYAGLREHCTPEVMGYLAEELSDNATHGRRNEVKDLRLLQADVSEAWREGQMEYATAAMRYESIDVMRDRTSGAVISGDPDRPTETTELWTFVRPQGGAWKLSAIQET
jgi:predicted lipid-binding transport protein (Tim44 family)